MFSVLHGSFRNFKNLRYLYAKKCVRFVKQWDPIALQALVTSPTKNDHYQIKHLIKSCIVDDPLLTACGMITCEPCVVDYLMGKVDEGDSIVAKSLNGTLIGVAVNSINSRSEATELRYLAAQAWSDASKRVCFFWSYLEKQPGIWEHFEVTHVWQIRLFVHPAYRQHGIGKLLTQASRSLARRQDYSLVKMECTNHYAARIAQSLGFKCILSTPMQMYLTKDRKPLFKECPEHPHDLVKVYINQFK